MQLTQLLLAFSGVAGIVAQHSPLVRRDDNPSPETAENKTAVAPKRFILEFSKGVKAEAAANQVATLRGTKVLRVFNSDIFTGVAVETEEENIDTLETVEPVLKAWQSKRIKLAPSAPLKSFSEEATAFNYSIHHMTGVDKLHEAGVLGKGAKVAIVDTGVYYTHPALGGGIGPGFKIAGGYDLVGDGVWPEAGEKEPDTDPMDQQGHGTHVSGIIAGKSDIFTGVAPEATLYMYKVFSQIDGTDEDTLIDAFLMAYNEGADIITSSIGGLSGWTDGPWAVVASRLVDQGVVVTISAGNDGQAGAYAASSGSSGEHVVAVASIEPDVLAVSSFKGTFNLDGASNETYVAYLSMNDWYPSDVQGWPIVPLSMDTAIENEACESLPADTPDLTNTVVLIRRGGCNFSVKQQNLAPFNASHILFYTNDMPVVIPTTDDTSSNIAMIQAEAGAAIIDTIKAGGNVTADFTEAPIKHIVGVPNGEDGRAPSTFTSLGATNELFIKPDVAAPGGRILSTYLDNGFAILSGTSMACPYVAGVAALYIGEYGGRDTHGPDFAKSLAMRLISSGEAVRWDDGTGEGNDFGFLAPVPQVGTGLINASKVLDYTTALSFSKFALNDTHHFSRYHSVDITNEGTVPVTYSFSAQSFGGMETVLTDTAYWGVPRIAWFEEVMAAPKAMIPSISFPGGTFTVKPGETRTAKISFNYPEGLNPANLPLYSGKIVISGSNGEVLSVPYMGLAADLHKDIGIMFQSPIGFPTLTSLRTSVPISEKSNFTFDLDPEVQDFPQLYTRMNYATTELRWDIFEAGWTERDWKYPPIVGKDGYIGSVTSWAQASGKSFFNASSDDVNDLISLPLRDVPRDIAGVYGIELWWLGRLANGTQIAPGKYNMRFAALVPFGNPAASDNWDIFETPEFEVLSK